MTPPPAAELRAALDTALVDGYADDDFISLVRARKDRTGAPTPMRS